MGPTPKHPHIYLPTDDQIAELLQTKATEVRDLYLEVHRLVLETLPDIAYSVDCHDGDMGYGARQYGYDGWGMGALAAHGKWVSLTFIRGADLEAPEGLLEGSSKTMRHVKLRSPAQLAERREALRELLLAAAKLNGS